MRSITYHQGLLGVSLVGLTLVLAEGWQVVAALRLVLVEGEGGFWIPFTVILQGVAVVIPIAAIRAALPRWSDGRPRPLTNKEFLQLIGLFGLILVSTKAPHTPSLISQLGLELWTGGVFVAQVLAFAIPVWMLVKGGPSREESSPDGPEDTLTLSRLIHGLALLGLIFAASGTPGAITVIAFLDLQGYLVAALAAHPIAILAVSGFMLAGVLALSSSRIRESVGTTGSAALLGTTALLVLGAATLAWNPSSPAGSFDQLVAIVAIAGLFLARAVTAGDPNGPPPPPGSVLVATGLAGMMVTTVSVLAVVELSFPIEGDLEPWSADQGVPGFVITGMAAAINLAVLLQGVRRLREGSDADRRLLPRTRATVVAMSPGHARRGAALLSLTVALMFGWIAVGLIWSILEFPESRPSVAIPMVLVVVAIGIALALTQMNTRRFGDPAGEYSRPGPATGLTYSDLLTATGILGLVIVAALASLNALAISVLVWEGSSSPTRVIVAQGVVFLVPVAVIMMGLAKARRAALSPDEHDDGITLPRLAVCLALLGAAMAASDLPLVVETLRVHEFALGPASRVGLLIQLSAGLAAILAAFVLLLGGADRASALFESAPAPVVAGVVGLGVVVVVASFGVPAMLPIGLGALSVVALHLFGSDEDPAPGTEARTAIWHRATVPLLGLAFLMPFTPALAGILSLNPTEGFAIFTIFLLAFAYAINAWPLARAIRQLRNEWGE